MKVYIIITFLLGILVGSLIGYYSFPLINRSSTIYNKEAAYSYLLTSYNSTLGLCYEYPNDTSRYWLSHDNVLASFVLRDWNLEISNNISKTVGELAQLYGLERHPSGLLKDGRVDILFGYSYDALKNISTSFERSYLGSKVKTETVENQDAEGTLGYADLLCYASLMQRWEGKSNISYSYYVMFKAMWNGNGFEDDFFKAHHKYETYKLGLFYLLSKIIGQDFEFEEQLLKIVGKCQDANGGFRTHYYMNISDGTDEVTFPSDSYTNTETTSIILLANVPSHVNE